MNIVDISDTNNPIIISTYQNQKTNWIAQSSKNSNIIFIVDSISLKVVDISNTKFPTIIGELETGS